MNQKINEMSFYYILKITSHYFLVLLFIVLHLQCHQSYPVKSGSIQTDSTSLHYNEDSIVDSDSNLEDGSFMFESDDNELLDQYSLSKAELSVLNKLSNKSKLSKDEINYLVKHFGFSNEMDRPDKIILNKKIRIIGDSTGVHVWRIASDSGYPEMDQLYIFHPYSQKIFNVNGVADMQFLKFSKNADPYILIYTSTNKGNGDCDLIRWNGNRLESVLYNTFPAEYPRMYDAHLDDDYIIGDKLNPVLTDINKDGHMDVIFEGRIFTDPMQFYNPDRYSKYKDTTFYDNFLGETVNGKIVPVQIKYIYQAGSGIFRCNQDLSKEYIDPYDDSK